MEGFVHELAAADGEKGIVFEQRGDVFGRTVPCVDEQSGRRKFIKDFENRSPSPDTMQSNESVFFPGDTEMSAKRLFLSFLGNAWAMGLVHACFSDTGHGEFIQKFGEALPVDVAGVPGVPGMDAE